MKRHISTARYISTAMLFGLGGLIVVLLIQPDRTPAPAPIATESPAAVQTPSVPPKISPSLKPKPTTTATTAPAPTNPVISGTAFEAATTNAYVSAVLTALNEARAKQNLPALTLQRDLQESAYLKLDDMLQKAYFAHTSPEGKTGFAFIKEAGYIQRYAGENLARYFEDASNVLPAFLDSPTHKANVLHKSYTDIGLAYSPTDNLLVVHFGSR